MTPEAIRTILSGVTFPDTEFLVEEGSGWMVLRVEVKGRCNVTGEPSTWKGRKWPLSKHMTKSEVVQTAFLAVQTATEHEVREQFKFKGAAIFGPHFSVDRLVTLAFDPSSQDARL